MKIIKSYNSCNSNPESCILRREFNSCSSGLSCAQQSLGQILLGCRLTYTSSVLKASFWLRNARFRMNPQSFPPLEKFSVPRFYIFVDCARTHTRTSTHTQSLRQELQDFRAIYSYFEALTCQLWAVCNIHFLVT